MFEPDEKTNQEGGEIMGFRTLWKYLGIAMEAAEVAGETAVAVAAATAPDSPGGAKITVEERKVMVESLDASFSTALTGICRECGLPVKSIKVEVEME